MRELYDAINQKSYQWIFPLVDKFLRRTIEGSGKPNSRESRPVTASNIRANILFEATDFSAICFSNFLAFRSLNEFLACVSRRQASSRREAHLSFHLFSIKESECWSKKLMPIKPKSFLISRWIERILLFCLRAWRLPPRLLPGWFNNLLGLAKVLSLLYALFAKEEEGNKRERRKGNHRF